MLHNFWSLVQLNSYIIRFDFDCIVCIKKINSSFMRIYFRYKITVLSTFLSLGQKTTPLAHIQSMNSFISYEILGGGARGHRPKNGPKKAHFRVKICKMHLFCLNLKILGEHVPPWSPPLTQALKSQNFFSLV